MPQFDDAAPVLPPATLFISPKVEFSTASRALAQIPPVQEMRLPFPPGLVDHGNPF